MLHRLLFDFKVLLFCISATFKNILAPLQYALVGTEDDLRKIVAHFAASLDFILYKFSFPLVRLLVLPFKEFVSLNFNQLFEVLLLLTDLSFAARFAFLNYLALLLVLQVFLLLREAHGDRTEAAGQRLQAQEDLLWKAIIFVKRVELRDGFTLEFTIHRNVRVSKVSLCDCAVFDGWALHCR